MGARRRAVCQLHLHLLQHVIDYAVPQLSGLGTLSLLVCVGKMCLLHAVFEGGGQDEPMVRRGRIQGFLTPV